MSNIKESLHTSSFYGQTMRHEVILCVCVAVGASVSSLSFFYLTKVFKRRVSLVHENSSRKFCALTHININGN